MAIYPHMQLTSPASCCFIASSRDHPIQLHDLLTPNIRANYPLIDLMTEKYHTPASLIFSPSDSNKFIAGTTSQLSFFDLQRPGEGPMVGLKTIPTRRSAQTGYTMKGIISALAVAPGSSEGTGVLAAGTYSRQVGLYSAEGTGETIGVFGLSEEEGGAGVTQLLWSQCGRYLYIAERKSEVIAVYDIRVAGEKVESFRGRRASTNQRVGIDVAHALSGEVVGGGVDGKVKVWEGGHGKGGVVGGAKCEWVAHDDVVSSAVVHPSGVLLATCSGSRNGGMFEDQLEGRKWDNSLKIWALKSIRTDSEVEYENKTDHKA